MPKEKPVRRLTFRNPTEFVDDVPASILAIEKLQDVLKDSGILIWAFETEACGHRDYKGKGHVNLRVQLEVTLDNPPMRKRR